MPKPTYKSWENYSGLSGNPLNPIRWLNRGFYQFSSWETVFNGFLSATFAQQANINSRTKELITSGKSTKDIAKTLINEYMYPDELLNFYNALNTILEKEKTERQEQLKELIKKKILEANEACKEKILASLKEKEQNENIINKAFFDALLETYNEQRIAKEIKFNKPEHMQYEDTERMYKTSDNELPLPSKIEPTEELLALKTAAEEAGVFAFIKYGNTQTDRQKELRSAVLDFQRQHPNTIIKGFEDYKPGILLRKEESKLSRLKKSADKTLGLFSGIRKWWRERTLKNYEKKLSKIHGMKITYDTHAKNITATSTQTTSTLSKEVEEKLERTNSSFSQQDLTEESISSRSDSLLSSSFSNSSLSTPTQAKKHNDRTETININHLEKRLEEILISFSIPHENHQAHLIALSAKRQLQAANMEGDVTIIKDKDKIHLQIPMPKSQHLTYLHTVNEGRMLSPFEEILTPTDGKFSFDIVIARNEQTSINNPNLKEKHRNIDAICKFEFSEGAKVKRFFNVEESESHLEASKNLMGGETIVKKTINLIKVAPLTESVKTECFFEDKELKIVQLNNILGECKNKDEYFNLIKQGHDELSGWLPKKFASTLPPRNMLELSGFSSEKGASVLANILINTPLDQKSCWKMKKENEAYSLPNDLHHSFQKYAEDKQVQYCRVSTDSDKPKTALDDNDKRMLLNAIIGNGSNPKLT